MNSPLGVNAGRGPPANPLPLFIWPPRPQPGRPVRPRLPLRPRPQGAGRPWLLRSNAPPPANACSTAACRTAAARNTDLGHTPEVQTQIVVGIIAVLNVVLRLVTKTAVGR